MLRSALTLEELLSKMSDESLLCINKEMSTGIVPASGYARRFCRKVNRLIDAGSMCINPATHRKVYLPTAAKEVQREIARRWQASIETKTNSYVMLCSTCEEETTISEVENAVLYSS